MLLTSMQGFFLFICIYYNVFSKLCYEHTPILVNFNKIPFLEISQLAMHDDTIGDNYDNYHNNIKTCKI